MAVVFNGENVGIAFPIERQDRLQWKCDNMKSLNYEFQSYEGSSLDSVLIGLDTSEVTNMKSMFSSCGALTTIPLLDTGKVTDMSSMFSGCLKLTTIPVLNTSNVTNFNSFFYNCGNLLEVPQLDTSSATMMSNMFGYCSKLTTIPVLNTSNVISMNAMFYYCSALTEVPSLDTGKVTDMGLMFYSCSQLTTVTLLDMIETTNVPSMFYNCRNLTNLTLKNIKIALQIGSGYSFGTLLTDASLINTAKELWDNTGSSSKKLTVSTPSNARFDQIYVKLITATEEMIAEDQYINNKKPCVVCESTDEGAMTLREYVVSKNWALA